MICVIRWDTCGSRYRPFVRLTVIFPVMVRYEGQYLDDMQHGYGVAMYVGALSNMTTDGNGNQ